MEENRKQYLSEYQKEKIKRVPLDMQKSYYSDVLKPAADSVGEPVNTFIKKAIQDRIDSLHNIDK